MEEPLIFTQDNAGPTPVPCTNFMLESANGRQRRSQRRKCEFDSRLQYQIGWTDKGRQPLRLEIDLLHFRVLYLIRQVECDRVNTWCMMHAEVLHPRRMALKSPTITEVDHLWHLGGSNYGLIA